MPVFSAGSAKTSCIDVVFMALAHQGHGPLQGHRRGGFKCQSAHIAIFKGDDECQVLTRVPQPVGQTQ